MKICILGAGPTGLGAAHRLSEYGVPGFRMFDRNAHFGGLAASLRDSAGFTWDFAVHVTHSHYHHFDRVLDQALPDGYYHHERRSWVRLHGAYVPYPFQYNFRHLPPESRWECVEGLLDLQRNGGAPRPENFEKWVLSAFGAGIARHFMVPYNHKLWTVHPSEMGSQWIGDRVPQVDVKRVLRNIVLGMDDVSWGPNHTFQFPKTGGTGAIWQSLGKALPSESVALEHDVVRIDPRRRLLTFGNGREESYDRLISTLPIPELIRLCGLDNLAPRAAQLKHSHVYVVGVAPAHRIPEELRDKTWVYCPEPACAFYRLTPFSTFSPAHVPDIERQCSFLCEISVPSGQHRSAEDLRAQAFQGLVAGGFLPEVAPDTHAVIMDAEYGYPIPTPDRDAILADVLPALESLHIYSRGRFGGWKYEVSNMDHSFMQGVEVVDRILKDRPEQTLPFPDKVNAGKQ